MNLWIFHKPLNEGGGSRCYVWFHLEVTANGLLRKHDAVKSAVTRVRLVFVHLHLVMLRRFPFPVTLTGRPRERDREGEREGGGWGLFCILGGLFPIVGKLNIYIL